MRLGARPGLGRTGTYSLKLALERLLGGRCHHMAEVLADRERQLELWAPVLHGDAVDWEEVFGRSAVSPTWLTVAPTWRARSG